MQYDANEYDIDMDDDEELDCKVELGQDPGAVSALTDAMNSALAEHADMAIITEEDKKAKNKAVDATFTSKLKVEVKGTVKQTKAKKKAVKGTAGSEAVAES